MPRDSSWVPGRIRPTPVCTPIRTASSSVGSTSFRSAISSRIRKAARTARSGSSPWATGAPNTPCTASPMNFSIVPPYACRAAVSRSKYGSIRARTSSGSAFSDAAVNPTRSQNRTVTTLRWSAMRAGTVPKPAPQARQNFARSGLSSPQVGQAATDGLYVDDSRPGPGQEAKAYWSRRVAPAVRFELTTKRLTAARSTTELRRNGRGSGPARVASRRPVGRIPQTRALVDVARAGWASRQAAVGAAGVTGAGPALEALAQLQRGDACMTRG